MSDFFADYFLILGPSETSSSGNAMILQCIPEEKPDFLLPRKICDVCFETGLITSKEYFPPKYYSSVSYSPSNGHAVYIACLGFMVAGKNGFVSHCFALVSKEFHLDSHLEIVLRSLLASSTSGLHHTSSTFELGIATCLSSPLLYSNHTARFAFASNYQALLVSDMPSFDRDANIEIFHALNDERLSALFLGILCGRNIMLISNSPSKRMSILTLLRLLHPFSPPHVILPVCPVSAVPHTVNAPMIVGVASVPSNVENMFVFHLDKNKMAASESMQKLPGWPAKYRQRLMELLASIRSTKSPLEKLKGEFKVLMNHMVDSCKRHDKMKSSLSKHASSQFYIELFDASCNSNSAQATFSYGTIRPKFDYSAYAPLMEANKMDAKFRFAKLDSYTHYAKQFKGAPTNRGGVKQPSFSISLDILEQVFPGSDSLLDKMKSLRWKSNQYLSPQGPDFTFSPEKSAPTFYEQNKTEEHGVPPQMMADYEIIMNWLVSLKTKATSEVLKLQPTFATIKSFINASVLAKPVVTNDFEEDDDMSAFDDIQLKPIAPGILDLPDFENSDSQSERSTPAASIKPTVSEPAGSAFIFDPILKKFVPASGVEPVEPAWDSDESENDKEEQVQVKRPILNEFNVSKELLEYFLRSESQQQVDPSMLVYVVNARTNPLDVLQFVK